ncbi:MAG: PTS transporter subunit IIC [Anaerococcus prevotii]|uniref:PTS galactitol transporter subunit IIC n=1 Tax=Anaerococcus prevotii TaxID=33034 RepID=UPI002901D75C|nr:PTS transporter subunit IIC [Anaerococcus prevotii]MDU2558502.1 PTS transporter subunit IIC [Anaerococcus prevotii]MDU3136989.1 PTS transporter subunit IIC [Anaerococcus prevotii]
MSGIIEFANTYLGKFMDIIIPSVLMLLVLTIISVIVGVKFSKALEGGIRLAISITAIGAVMNILTSSFSEALQAFVGRTGIELSITDVGWAPLATITWGSPYTLYFLLVMIIVNIVMLLLNKTNTLDVDIFDIWHLAITGLFAMYMGANLLVTTLLVIFIGVLKIINSDLMKPTFNDLLDAPDENPMTTTHMNYMMNPIVMLFNKIIDKIFPFLDKYDFDAAKLNSKIGFWGSKSAIGIYLGLFIGLLAGMPLMDTFTLAFTAATCLELFSVIGQWFIESVEPLSQGIADFANKKLGGRTLNIGLDWPFIAGRSEMWAAANILAPIMLLIAIILPGNKVLPLGGIIAMGLTPALLVVTRGRIIRMILIGIFMLPIFLWSGTLIAPYATEAAKSVNAFPAGLSESALITHSTLEGPVEKFVAYFVGLGNAQGGKQILIALVVIAVYLALFLWYRKEMIKRNEEYKAGKEDVIE